MAIHGQLKTYHDARKTKRQHREPCSDCPFARTALPGWLGRMSVEDWIEAAHGESTIECHTTDKLCAGAAIYRANVAKSLRDPNAFKLPPNTKLCFGSIKEFIEHHQKEKKCSS